MNNWIFGVYFYVAFLIYICTASTSVLELRTNLLKDYKKEARPVKNHKTNTTIKFGVSLLNVNLKDEDQLMEIVSILHVSWYDEFLKWGKDSKGIEILHFDPNEIWVPDVALFNSAKGSNISPKSSFPLVVKHDGRVTWLPPFNAEVPCQVNLFSWPRDKNSCIFRFGSWAHHGEQVDLYLDDWVDNSISLSRYQQNNKWKFVNATAERQVAEFDGDKFIHLDFTLTVQREAASHVAYVTHTALAVMICILSSYLLPLRFQLTRLSIHLFGIGILVLCDIALFMSIPATGGPVPHIIRYYSGTIVLTTMSLICNVVLVATLNMHSKFTSQTNRRQRQPLQEFNYVPLEEELSEISVRGANSMSENHLVGAMEQQHQSMPAEQTTAQDNAYTPKFVSKDNIHKALNMLFFGMYSIAYVIDYIVMKSSISS